MSPSEKLSILLALAFAGTTFIAFMITMRSIGNISHSLDRLEEIISKEVIITYRKQVKILKKLQQKEMAQRDRVRRQKALLNVPLLDMRPPTPPKD